MPAAPPAPAEPRRAVAVFLLAGATYVAAGLAWKGVLNWIVGPAWYVAFCAADARLRRWRGSR